MGNIIARAQGGRAQIVDTSAGVLQTFGVDVQTAIIQGGEVVVTLTNGKTQMDDPGMLSGEEIDEGLTLTCISKPNSEEITIDYDDV